MCKTVKGLMDAINHCCYLRKENDPNKDVLVCNLCGSTALSLIEMLEHLREYHKNDNIPDVDPTN